MVDLAPRSKPSPTFTGSGVNTNLYVNTGSINHYVEADIPTTGRTKLMLSLATDQQSGWRTVGNVGSPGQGGTNLYYQLGANGVRDLTQPTTAWPSDAVRFRADISANGIVTTVYNASGVATVVGSVPLTLTDAWERTTYAGARPTGDDPYDGTPVTLNNVRIGPSDLPLTIGQAVINGVTSPRFEIEYWSDSAPTYTIEFRSVTIVNGAFVVGSVIAAAAAATIAYTSAPGYARLLATNLPTGQSNKYVEATIRQVGRSEAVAKVISHVHNPMTVGDNIFNYMVYGHSGRVMANEWLQGEWAGGRTYDWQNDGGGVIDANGELARFPNGSEGGQIDGGFGIVARRIGCPDVPGRQLLTWDGTVDSSQIFGITTQGDAAVAGTNITRPSANSFEYDSVFDRSVPSQRGSDLAMQIRGPAGSTASMKNVRLYPKSESDRDRVFGQTYVSSILAQRKGPIRLMQALATNGGSFGINPDGTRFQTARNWSERATLANITRGHPYGFPPEVLADLCVSLQRSMWICSKPGWTQDFMTGIIQMIDAKYTAAGLTNPILFETGNEPWNTSPGFNNYGWNRRYALDIGVATQAEYDNDGGAVASLKGRKALHEQHVGWAKQALQATGSTRKLIVIGNAQAGGGFYDPTMTCDAWAVAPYWGKESDTAQWRAGMRVLMRNQVRFAHTVWQAGQRFMTYESALEAYAVSDATYLAYTESSAFRADFDEFLGLWRDMFGDHIVNYSDLNTTGAGSASFGALHYQGSTTSGRHNSLNAMQLLLDAGTEPAPVDPPVVINPPPVTVPNSFGARLLFRAGF